MATINNSPIGTQSKQSGWSDKEHDILHQALMWRRKYERDNHLTLTRDSNLWPLMVTEMKKHGIDRTQNACRMYWSRHGRNRSGFEERANPKNPDVLGSCLQLSKVGKSSTSKIIKSTKLVSAESDSAPITPQKKIVSIKLYLKGSLPLSLPLTPKSMEGKSSKKTSSIAAAYNGNPKFASTFSGTEETPQFFSEGRPLSSPQFLNPNHGLATPESSKSVTEPNSKYYPSSKASRIPPHGLHQYSVSLCVAPGSRSSRSPTSRDWAVRQSTVEVIPRAAKRPEMHLWSTITKKQASGNQ